MRAYIVRRLLLMVPTMILVTIIVFSLVRFIPGDVIDIMVGEMGGEMAVDSDYLRHVMGLDIPIHIQYGRWLVGVVQGDLGDSLWQGIAVRDLIFERIPITLELGCLAIGIALLIALPIGAYSGIRQDTKGDYLGRTTAILCISIPSFWLGTVTVVYPSVWWHWAPALSYISPAENLAGNLVQFIVPAFIMGMVLSGTTMRLTRTMMLEVLRQDYIRTAWSKGLPERTIILRHALKNAMIPVVSMIGLLIPVVIAGTVVVEQIFCLPGIGLLLIDSLNKRDYPIISGINLVVACVVLTINLVVDLTYGYLDPRIQYK